MSQFVFPKYFPQRFDPLGDYVWTRPMRAGGEDVKAGDPVKLDDFSNRKLTSFLHERWICPVSQEDDDDQTGQVGGNNQLPPSNLYVKKLGRGRYVVMEGDQALTGEMLEGEAQRELQKYLE